MSIDLFNFELEDNKTALEMIGASEAPIRALFVQSVFKWRGWHHENSAPDRSPDVDFYGLWGVYYDSTPGDRKGRDVDEPEESLLRRGDLVCTIRFPRGADGFLKVMEISAALQTTIHGFKDRNHLEIKVGIATKWLDSLDQFENRALLMPFMAFC